MTEQDLQRVLEVPEGKHAGVEEEVASAPDEQEQHQRPPSECGKRTQKCFDCGHPNSIDACVAPETYGAMLLPAPH